MKIGALAASGWVIVLAGCGLAANPQPPTLWLPKPVGDLQAARVGDEVLLRWKMPTHTTDNVELRGPQRAHICWIRPQGQTAVFNQKLCRAAGDGSFAPDKRVEFDAPLPADLQQGTPGAVAFFVELDSPAGKTAGPSNAAWAATGTAPPPVTNLELQAAPDGVVVRWNKAAPEPGTTMRIQRALIPPLKARKPSADNGVQPPPEQLLEVDLSPGDPGGALDRDAALDHVYRYTAQRVRRVAVDGRTLGIAGLPSEPVTLEARNIFPPAVPQGLVAVSDGQAHAIDLSWRPDSGPALAGYVVYRQDVTAGSSWERISGAAPVVAPSFEDRNVMAGRQYAYAVSAVDRDGNESARSAEVSEQLPQS
jgi:hypothetical protein